MPLYAPNVNAYRRYVAGSQAPVNVEWGPTTAPPACVRAPQRPVAAA